MWKQSGKGFDRQTQAAKLFEEVYAHNPNHPGVLEERRKSRFLRRRQRHASGNGGRFPELGPCGREYQGIVPRQCRDIARPKPNVRCRSGWAPDHKHSKTRKSDADCGGLQLEHGAEEMTPAGWPDLGFIETWVRTAEKPSRVTRAWGQNAGKRGDRNM